ncbi:hypothetical protein [Bifidobacterium leontopitheci]|nr:hypothetical protein [Bifidobacterium leontopitheci]
MRDLTDVLWYAALALMPVDGTVFGVQMPYWSPIAPVLFLLYAVCNARRLPLMFQRHPAVLPLVGAMLLVSVFGWLTIGVNGVYLTRTVLALLFAVATLASLGIALDAKRLSPRAMVTALAAAYGVAFLFGVFTWVCQPGHLNISRWRDPLMQLYLRQYFVSRPQFLFAEPSYIGMHLYGVLLPVYWLTRDRRLPVLIGVFAAGSLVMGAGVRIVIDTAAAAVLWFVAAFPWGRLLHDRRLMAVTAGFACVGVGGGVAAFVTQPRLQSLLSSGLFAGDASMSARMFRSLAPLEAGANDVWHLLFGFGAGNLGEAMRRGYAGTLAWYQGHGGTMTDELRELADPLGPTTNRAGNAFTMNAYSSFVTEFGLVLFVAAVALLVWHVTRHHAWSWLTVCWLLLLVYLYAQFEAYAFLALPLFVWATADDGVAAGESDRGDTAATP